MEKIKCTISYDGSRFSGFQIQPKQRTVHGELERALKKMHKGEHIRLQASGRTDTGVHAKGQVIHFASPFHLPEANWKKALNTLLPNDLYVQKVEHVPMAFHARYDAVEKEYRYFVLNKQGIDVFQQNYVYQFPYTLDIHRIQDACRYFEGKHDFTTFSSAKTTIKGEKVRTLYDVRCTEEGEYLMFTFRGDGFLYHMIRTIVGVLLDVGQGRLEADTIPSLFDSRDRQKIGATIPPQGLYLWNVLYGEKDGDVR